MIYFSTEYGFSKAILKITAQFFSFILNFDYVYSWGQNYIKTKIFKRKTEINKNYTAN